MGSGISMYSLFPLVIYSDRKGKQGKRLLDQCTVLLLIAVEVEWCMDGKISLLVHHLPWYFLAEWKKVLDYLAVSMQRG